MRDGGGRDLLLVGVWGFPGNWFRANYMPLKPPQEIGKWPKFVEWENIRREVTSHSTTLSMARFLEDEGWNVKTLIYGMDTLACPGRARELEDEIQELILRFRDSPPRQYKEILERAAEVLRLYVKSYSEEVGLKANSIDISIVPGIGTFRLAGGVIRYQFLGSITTCSVSLELDLYEKLKESECRAVILDISHGINYLPSLALEALNRAVRVYSALTGSPIGFAVCNGDPVMSSGQNSVIHLVRAQLVEETPFSLLAPPGLILPERSVKMLERRRPPEHVRTFEDGYREVRGRLERFTYSASKVATHGLVLYLVTQLSNMRVGEDWLSPLQRVVEGVKQLINLREVNSTANLVKVSYSYSLEPDLPIISYLSDLVEKLVEKAPELEETEVSEIGRAKLVDLEDLKRYAEEVAGLKQPAKRLFEYEISNIEKRVCGLRSIFKEGGVELLSTIHSLADKCEEELESVRRECIKKLCQIDRRNFYAHAGMEMNSVVVSVSDGRILVGYPEKCLEELSKIVSDP